MKRHEIGAGLPETALPAGGHPSLEALLELSLGELPPAAAAAVEAHLRACPECLARYGSLLELPDPPPGSAGEEAKESAVQAAAWRELSRVLRLGEDEAEAAEPRPERPAAGGWRSPRPWLAAAALLPLAFLLGYLARAPTAPRSPGLAAAAPAQLVPEDFALLGRAERPKKVLCPPPGGVFSWVLTGLGSGAGRGAAYQIEIARPDGGLLRESGSVLQFGEIHLTLRQPGLPNGEYRIAVRVAAGKGQEVAKQYRLTLDCP